MTLFRTTPHCIILIRWYKSNLCCKFLFFLFFVALFFLCVFLFGGGGGISEVARRCSLAKSVTVNKSFKIELIFAFTRVCFTLIKFKWKAQNCYLETMIIFPMQKLYLDIINFSVDFYTLQCFISSSGVGFFGFRKWQRSGSLKFLNFKKKKLFKVCMCCYYIAWRGMVKIWVKFFFLFLFFTEQNVPHMFHTCCDQAYV